MNQFDGERFIGRFRRGLRIEPKIRLRMSDDDPELERLLKYMRARGSQSIEEDGAFVISIRSDIEVPLCVWYEECAHVLQVMRDGVVPLSCEDNGASDNEAEIARCLLERNARRRGPKLDVADEAHYREILNRWRDRHDSA